MSEKEKKQSNGNHDERSKLIASIMKKIVASNQDLSDNEIMIYFERLCDADINKLIFIDNLKDATYF